MCFFYHLITITMTTVTITMTTITAKIAPTTPPTIGPMLVLLMEVSSDEEAKNKMSMSS